MGGSSFLFTCLAIGIILSVARNAESTEGDKTAATYESDEEPDEEAVPRMSRKIIIAGGGTGGHIFPAIAIAGALQQQDPGIELLFVGAAGKMEMEKVPQAGYRIEGITIAGFNRSSLIKISVCPSS